MAVRDIVILENQPGIKPGESARLGAELEGALIDLAADLSDNEWATATRCDPWTVKDMCAHLIGWAEALTSFRELRSQVGRSFKRAKEFGNPTDAQNNIQVEDRRDMTPDQVVARMREVLPQMTAARKRWSNLTGWVPAYSGYLGGPINLAYLFNTIFLRDSLIHRLDIYAATGREPVITDADRRVMADMFKDWARRQGADVQIDHDGTTYVAAAGINTIRAPEWHVAEALSGRRDISTLEIDGDRARVEAWLEAGVPV